MSSIISMVNGDAYDSVGVTVKLLGQTVEGITAISYETQQAKQNNVGRGTKPVSRSRGVKTFTGSITMEEAEYRRIVNAAGGDITNIPAFPITVFKVRGTKSCTDKLKFVEFTGQAQDIQFGEGSMRNLVTMPLIIGDIDYGPEI